MPAIRATIDYIQYNDTRKPFVAVRDVAHQNTHTLAELSNVEWDSRNVLIEDMRDSAEGLSVEGNGFEALTRPSAVPQFSSLQDLRVYQIETESLLKARFKADHVICFDFKVSLF